MTGRGYSECAYTLIVASGSYFQDLKLYSKQLLVESSGYGDIEECKFVMQYC